MKLKLKIFLSLKNLLSIFKRKKSKLNFKNKLIDILKKINPIYLKFSIYLFKKKKKIYFNKTEKFLLLIFFFIFLSSFSAFLFFKTHKNIKKNESQKFIPNYGGKYIEGSIGYLENLHPYLANQDPELDIISLIYSSLFKINPYGELEKELAQSFKLASKQNQKYKYILKLKKNIYWHNNKKLTSDDVIFSYQSLKNLKPSHPLVLKNISLKKINQNTIEINSKTPLSPSFLTFKIIPQNTPSIINLEQENLEKNLIGTGPFKFDSLVKEKNLIHSISLKGNHQYWEKRPYLDKIIFIFYHDYETAISDLKSKKIDGLNNLPKSFKKEFEKLSQQGGIKINSLIFPQETILFFNQNKTNFLSFKNRQALAYLIPRKKILEEVLNNEGKNLFSPLPSSDPFFNPEIKKYEYNPEKAQSLLSLVKDSIKITTSQQPDLQKTAEIIAQEWKKFGFKIDLEILPKNKLLEKIKKRDYQILLYSLINPTYDPYPIWHSKEDFNFSFFSNKEVDQILEKTRPPMIEELKKKNYYRFQEIIQEQMPAIFLYQSNYLYPQDSKIKGFDLKEIQFPWQRFYQINQWYIKTKRR